jgi:hypothetical protein
MILFVFIIAGYYTGLINKQYTYKT